MTEIKEIKEKEIKEIKEENEIDFLNLKEYLLNNKIPSNNEIESYFKLILKLQLIPLNVQERLIKQLNINKKWDTIIAYYNMINNTSINFNNNSNNSNNNNSSHNNNNNSNNNNYFKYNDKDQQLLNILKLKYKDITLLLQLKTRICTGNKIWMKSFMNDGGLEIILKSIEYCSNHYPLGEYDAAILYELICCIKSIINNGMSMNYFLNIKDSIRILTSLLIFEWKPLVLQVLEILCVLCDYSSDTALKIIQYIKFHSYSQHKLPFEYLIQNIIDCDVDIKASILQFINHMICSVVDIKARIQIRNQLQSLQLYSICDIVIKDMSFELQQIKSLTLSTKNIRKGIHHMSSGIYSSNSPNSPNSSSIITTSTNTTSSTATELLSGPNPVLRIKTYFESNKSDQVMKWIRRKRIKAKHLLTHNSFTLNNDTEHDPYDITQSYIHTSSSPSILYVEPILYSHIAEDGKTPIRPYFGIMCGNLSTIKNHFSFRDLYHYGTTLKTRYFELIGNTFSWWNPKRKDDIPMGSILTSQIKSIRVQSYNEEIMSTCQYTFEIVLHSGHIYSYGCDDLLSYNNWLLALNYVCDRNLLLKSSYVLIPKDLNTDDFLVAKKKFIKQYTVFQILDQEDYLRYHLTFGPKGVQLTSKIESKKKQLIENDNDNDNENNKIQQDLNENNELKIETTITTPSSVSSSSIGSNFNSSTLNITNFLELAEYLYHNMMSVHLDSKLFSLLQELIIVPLGRPYGDIYWNILLSFCQVMRTSRQMIIEMSSLDNLTKSELLSQITKYIGNNIDLDTCLKEIINYENTETGKQTQEIRQLTKLLYQKDAEIKRLKDELESIKDSTKSRSGSINYEPLNSPSNFNSPKVESSQHSVAQLIETYSTYTGKSLNNNNNNNNNNNANNIGQGRSLSPTPSQTTTSILKQEQFSPRSGNKSRNHQRGNPSRDIRVTFLKDIEEKDNNNNNNNNNLTPRSGDQNNNNLTPLSIWSQDENELIQTRERKESSTLVDLSSEIRRLQNELQISNVENERLQQEIRMTKSSSVRANQVVIELFTKNAEIERLQEEVKSLRAFIENHSLSSTSQIQQQQQLKFNDLKLNEQDNLNKVDSTIQKQESQEIEFPKSYEENNEINQLQQQQRQSLRSTHPDITSQLNHLLNGNTNNNLNNNTVDNNGNSGNNSAHNSLNNKRRDSDSISSIRAKSVDSVSSKPSKASSILSNPFFRKVPKNEITQEILENTNITENLKNETIISTNSNDDNSNDNSNNNTNNQNNQKLNETNSESKLLSNTETPLKASPNVIGKLGNLSKSSSLLKLFGNQSNTLESDTSSSSSSSSNLENNNLKVIENNTLENINNSDNNSNNTNTDNTIEKELKKEVIESTNEKLKSENKNEKDGSKSTVVVGKLKRMQKSSALGDLFASRLNLPTSTNTNNSDSLSTPLPTSSTNGEESKETSLSSLLNKKALNIPKVQPNKGLPLAVPNSKRSIPIPPPPPGYTPINSTTQPIKTNGLPLAVPSSKRPIPIPPTPPFNVADYINKSKVSNNGPPGLPLPGNKKQVQYVSKHKAKCKMKGVFWNKLSTTQCSKSVFWSSITIKQLDHLEIDYDILEESFSESKPTTGNNNNTNNNNGVGNNDLNSNSQCQQDNKPKIITLFDSRRTQNILISSGRLKLSPLECVEIITDLNPLNLSIDKTEIMLTLVPTNEEIQQLTNYNDDIKYLGKSEQLLYHLKGIYRLKERLECHRLIFNWNITIDRLTAEINILSTACHELMSNETRTKLATVFSVILAIGNFMNGGSSRIATGITLDSIIKFGTIKASKESLVIKKNETLLHYIVRQLETKYPDSLTFYENWRCVSTACEISYNQIQIDMKTLQTELKYVQDEMKLILQAKEQCSNRFIEMSEERFVPFIAQGQNLLQHLQVNIESTEKVLKSTFEIFGENFNNNNGSSGSGSSGGNDDQCQQFFKTLSTVMTLFQKIRLENQQTDLARKKIAEKAAAVGLSKQQKNKQNNTSNNNSNLTTTSTSTTTTTKAGDSNETGNNSSEGNNNNVGKTLRIDPSKLNQENIFDKFQLSEEETSDKIVELLRAKIPIRRASATS